MREFEIKPELHKKLIKLSKKSKKIYEAVMKKIEEVISSSDIEHYKNLRIFPSPFHVPSETPMVVDGLKDASSLKVMTITGRVLRDIKNIDLGIHGDQIPWDGRDKQGRWVGSGVYLLSVYDETGESTFGKVTVIRH